ncbi:hypothetical protein IAU59_007358 [Kwoniella sp. CBS 9459]
MSFIGTGALEHKVTQLQRQLDHKDHEINSIRNEQRKRDEELAAAKRAKEDAEYKLRDEAERAHRAETNVTAKSTEISQLKLKLLNLESSLTQTSNKLKIEERDKDRIQDALDAALSGGADGAAQQVRDLQNRTKQLEGALKAAELEKEKSRSQGSSNDPWGSGEPLSRGERNRLMALQNQVESLKEENERLQASSSRVPASGNSFAPATSTSPSRPKTKRRSMSSSGPSAASEMIELENQVKTLREQLVAKKRDLDKSVNEKLAVEIAAKKKSERLESELEDIRAELDYHRSNEGGDGLKELEKAKKAAQAEKEHLASQLREKAEELKQRTSEVKKLTAIADKVNALEVQLEEERQARQQLEEAAATLGPSSDNVDNGSVAKIESLEAEVTRLRAQSVSGNAKTSDGDVRQIRRDLQKAVRDKEYLESLVRENDELLAEKDGEIDRLKTAMPIPGSPTLAARDDGRIEQLQKDKLDLQDKLENDKERYESEIAALERRVNEAAKQLETARAAESALKLEVQTFTSARSELENGLKQAAQDLSAREMELIQIRETYDQLQQDNEVSRVELKSVKQAADTAESRLQEALTSLSEKESLLADLVKQRDDLETTLATRSHDDSVINQLRSSSSDLQTRLAEVQTSLQIAEDARDELQARVETANKDKEESLAQLQTARNELSEAQRRVESSEGEMQSISVKSEETIKLLSEQVDDLTADLSTLQIRYDDKVAELATSVSTHDEVQNRFEQAVKEMNQLHAKVVELEEATANRSTESESGAKDEQLFNLQERNRTLEKTWTEAKESHKQEMEAAKHKAEQDLLETQAQISALEKRIADLQAELTSVQQRQQKQPPSSSSGSSEVKQFEQKIAQLRAERDELRHNISFVQNERHFAVRAALSDKDSALADLQRIREEFKNKSALCERLTSEVEDAKTALDQARKASQEMVSPEEQARLTERIALLESELRQQTSDVQGLRSQLEASEDLVKAAEERAKAAESRAEGFQKELLDMVHHVGQLTKLSDPPRPTSTSPTSNEFSDVPADLAAIVDVPAISAQAPERSKRLSIGHARSRSNASISVIPAVIPNLNPERQQLLARIGRRDARIAELTHDLDKANLNLTLAQEAQQDTLEDLSELTEERDRLQAELEEAAHFNPDIDRETLRSLVLSLVVYRQSVKSSEARRGLSQTLLRTARITNDKLRTSLSSATQSLSVKEEHLSAVEQEKASIEARLAQSLESASELQADLSNSRQALEDLQSRLAVAETSNASSDAKLAASIIVLEEQVAEKEERVRELQLQNGNLATRMEGLEEELAESRTSTADEIAGLTLKVDVLTKEQESKAQKIEELENEKEGLAEEINAAERALEDGMAEAQLQRETIEADAQAKGDRVREIETTLKEKEEQIAQLSSQVENLNQSLEESKLKDAQSAFDIEGDRAVVDKLQQDLASAREAADASEAKLARLKAHLEDVQATLKDTEAKKANLEGEIENMRVAAAAESERAKAMDGLSVRLEEVQASLNITEKKKTELEQEVGGLRAAASNHAEKVKEIERLSVELEKAQNALKVLEVEHAAHQKELTNARATAEADAAKIKELKEMSVQLDLAKKAKDEVDLMIGHLREEMQSVHEAKREVEYALTTHKGDMSELSTKLESLQAELIVAQNRANNAAQEASAKQGEVDELRKETVDLKNQLEKALADAEAASASAAAPVPVVDEGLISELKERIEQLELSLSRKNEEVDEADDRTREAFKANAKLEKKIGKLQRQIESLQVEKNTAINKAMSLEASRSVPVPVTASVSAPVVSASAGSEGTGKPPAVASAAASAPAAASTGARPRASLQPSSSTAPSSASYPFKQRVVSAPSSTPQRTPLSSVNIFIAPPNANIISNPAFGVDSVPSSGHKRHRETDEVDLTKPTVEAIMLPTSTTATPASATLSTAKAARPAAPPSSTSPRRLKAGIIKSSFTPQRGFTPTNGGGGGSGRPASSGMGSGHKNVFAGAGAGSGSGHNENGIDIARQRPAFPLPPHRNVFGPK